MRTDLQRKQHREYMRRWRRANPERCLQYERAWRRAHPKHCRSYWRAYRRRHRAKVLARRLINDAIRRGMFTRRACEICGTPEAQAHHPDYSRPFEIHWLCREHHHEHHLAEQAGQRSRPAR
jgi:hypothetical protein